MPFIRRTGKPTLHYRIDDFTDPWKNAGTILLQHGYGRSSRFWYSWVPYLSRFYKVVRPDLRGHGESPVDFNPATDSTLEGYIDDILTLKPAVCARHVLHFAAQHDGIAGHE